MTTRTTEVTPELRAALAAYEALQSRAIHPDGTFDKSGRWYPSGEEIQPCCAGVRAPSRSYPYSYLTHARTAGHVASRHGVSERDLRRAYRAAHPAHREGGDHYYKAVAVTPEGFRSIFDGETVYEMNTPVMQRPRQGHAGGIYVYASMEAARNAAVPRNSALFDAPRAVIQVRAEGAYVAYPCDCWDCRYSPEHPVKFAFGRVTPLAVAIAAV